MKTSHPPICGHCGAVMPLENSTEATVLELLGIMDAQRKHGEKGIAYALGIRDALTNLGLAIHDFDRDTTYPAYMVRKE